MISEKIQWPPYDIMPTHSIQRSGDYFFIHTSPNTISVRTLRHSDLNSQLLGGSVYVGINHYCLVIFSTLTLRFSLP